MNHTKTIQAVAQRSLVAKDTCEQVLGAYEKYSEKNMSRSSRKHMIEITAAISETTGVEPEICETVMSHFFDLLSEEVKKKIPFVK
jgi:predicted ATPase